MELEYEEHILRPCSTIGVLNWKCPVRPLVEIGVSGADGEHTQITYAPGYRLYILGPSGWIEIRGKERSS